MKTIAHTLLQRGKISTTVTIALCLMACYVLTWGLFLSEGHPSVVNRGVPGAGIPMIGHVIAADLAKDTITLSLVPDITNPTLVAGRKLINDVDVELDTSVAVLTHKYKKGESPMPWVVTIPIQDGDLTEFPVDNYVGQFTLKAGVGGGEKMAPKLNIDKVVHGFKFASVSEASTMHAEAEIEFDLRRSPAVTFLAIMAMLSLTVVVCSAVNVAWQVATKGRKLEFGMMVWVAALLFVIPAVRGAMPGSPPPGAMVDVGLFFWLHVLTVIALLTLVSTWSRDGK